jgi:hypothetical protein
MKYSYGVLKSQTSFEILQFSRTTNIQFHRLSSQHLLSKIIVVASDLINGHERRFEQIFLSQAGRFA